MKQFVDKKSVIQQVYDKISRCQILWNQPHNCEHLATLIHTNEGTTKDFGEDCAQNTHNKLTVVKDLKQLADIQSCISFLIYFELSKPATTAVAQLIFVMQYKALFSNIM